MTPKRWMLLTIAAACAALPAFHRRPRLGETPRPTITPGGSRSVATAWRAAILAAHHPPTNQPTNQPTTYQPTHHPPTTQLTNKPTNQSDYWLPKVYRFSYILTSPRFQIVKKSLF